MKEVHIIYNPVSGQGQTTKALEKIQEWAKTQPELSLIVHPTENVGHATSITRDLTSTGQPVTIIVIGGDGSVNEVLNGINNFENTTFGILPFGSGNDFVRSLNLPTNDPVELMNQYVNNTTIRHTDFMVINDKYRAMNEVGLGMSAEVVAYRDKMKHFSPSMRYKVATVVKALFWKSFTYTISYDKQTPQVVRSLWFTINNGKAVGSGTITDPDAKIDDGLISISYLKTFKHIKTPFVLAKIKKGKIKEVKENVRLACREIDIQAVNATVEFDGNLLHHQTNINVKIVPGKLNLLVFGK